jgi:hypothetical protein
VEIAEGGIVTACMDTHCILAFDRGVERRLEMVG